MGRNCRTPLHGLSIRRVDRQRPRSRGPVAVRPRALPFVWAHKPRSLVLDPRVAASSAGLQVYQLRLEAALAELLLLKAQCGVDYSLTLVSAEREVQVLTSGEQRGRGWEWDGEWAW